MSTRDWYSHRADRGRSRFADASGTVEDEEFNPKLSRMAAALAQWFPDSRVRIGLWGANSLDYLAALFAVLRAGHTVVPLPLRSTPRELADIAEAVHLATLLMADELPLPHREALKRIPIHGLPTRAELTGPAPRIRELREDDVAALLCSSGSTGQPKIVPLTLRSLLAHADAVCAHLQVTWRDAWIVCLPLYHIGGLAIPFRSLSSSASLIFSRTTDAEELNHLIDEGVATLISVVPTVLERMLTKREGKPYPKSLRAIIVGGGPVPARLLERCPQAYATYGLTEAGSMVTCARPGCTESERKTAGAPLPETQVRIVNKDGKDVKKGDIGQIVVRGPGMARSYLSDDDKGKETFRSGWIWTGDMGRLDESGLLTVEARRSDVVLTGGENVYPGEIEKVLLGHPRIRAVVVLPVEDPTWGQAPAALIVLSEGRPLQKIHIYQFLEGRLARHKFPRSVVFASELPTLSNGKPDMKKIREILRGSAQKGQA